MLGALIIVFREVIEAGLIVGIVMAATRRAACRPLGRAGHAGGLAPPRWMAVFAEKIASAMAGIGQEMFNERARAGCRHARLAQHLDGAAWTRTGHRTQKRGQAVVEGDK